MKKVVDCTVIWNRGSIPLRHGLWQIRKTLSMLRQYISRRRMDFTYGFITDCYVVFNGQAVRVNARYQTRLEIENKISMLRPWTSQSTASYRRRLRSLMLSRLYATLIFFCCKVTHFSPFHQIFLPFSCVLSEKVAIFVPDKGMKWAYWPMET